MNNNKQSSSIDLLWEIAYNRELTVEDWKQAKAMHKEEIINAHTTGYIIGGGNGDIHEPKQYYEQTYGGNK